MKTTLYSTVATIILTIALTTNILAQNSPQWNLPDDATLRIGKGRINQIAYSPDDSILAVATHIGIWLYDAQTGNELDLLTGHTEAIRSIAFSPDGTILASGSSDNTIRLWDFPNRSHLRTLIGHTDDVVSIAFSSDGNTLASGSHDRTARLWDVNTGFPKQLSPQKHTRSITSVQFNKDSTILAVASYDDTISLYDVVTSRLLRTINADMEGVYALSFSPTENLIAGAGYDKTIRLWDTQTGDLHQNYVAHTHHIETLSFTSDGETVISGSRDTTIRVGNAKTGQKLITLTGHTGFVNTIALSSDGSFFASGSTDGTIREWRGYLDQNTSGQMRILSMHNNFGNTIDYAPNGKTFATGSIDGKVHLWHEDVMGTLQHRILTGHSKIVNDVEFSPNSKMLISGSSDGTMRLWDVETGNRIHGFTRSFGGIHDVAFSPNGKYVADIGHFRGTSIVVYDVETAEKIVDTQIYEFKLTAGPRPTHPAEHTDTVNSIIFSRDSKMIISCSDDTTIRMWDIETGTHKRMFQGHSNDVNHIALSPDGRTLASCSSDRTIRLWDIDTGTHQRTFTGFDGEVTRVTFSHDGSILASGGTQDTVNLWNVQSGKHLSELTGHKSWVYDVDFSSDGNTLASISADGTILLWDITPTEMQPTVSLSPATIESPNVGEQLTFSLNIADGVNVAGYQATVIYDNTALRYIQSANADFLPANVYTITPATTDNSVRIGAVAFGGKQNSMDGTLATVTFEVLAVKDSTVRLSSVLLTDPFGMPSIPKVASAHITEPTKLPEDVNEDGMVDVTDLVLVATQFGKRGENATDVNDDGVVDIVDLALVAAKIDENAHIGPEAPGLLTNLPTRATVASWLREARNLNITDPNFQRGIHFLEMLLANLTPQETALLPNFPNPFNPETWIPYQLAAPADVSIAIYTSDGKLIRTLDVGHQPVGTYQHRSNAAYWDGKNHLAEPVASGVYFYTLTAGHYTATRKMLIRK